MSFGLSDTVSCERCGSTKESSDADCTECSPENMHRFHFERIGSDEVVTTYSLNCRKWKDLMDQVNDPLPWKCRETGAMTADLKQMGIDVRDL